MKDGGNQTGIGYAQISIRYVSEYTFVSHNSLRVINPQRQDIYFEVMIQNFRFLKLYVDVQYEGRGNSYQSTESVSEHFVNFNQLSRA
jgi:hypothetical protein